jgi:hypothetical protein
VHLSSSRLHQSSGQTCFHVKQTARSQRVSHADLPLSVLWRNRQTESHLVLRRKPRNRHSNFEAQITKLKPPVAGVCPGRTPHCQALLPQRVATGRAPGPPLRRVKQYRLPSYGRVGSYYIDYESPGLQQISRLRIHQNYHRNLVLSLEGFGSRYNRKLHEVTYSCLATLAIIRF